MPKLIDEATKSLRRDAPTESQDEIANAVMRPTGKTHSVYALTPDERADLDAADVEIERAESAADEQVRAIWAKHGL